MARVKGGMMAQKRRKNILKRAKGYRGLRSKKERYAHEALLHAAKYSFNDRREKKNEFRQLWIVRLNAAVRGNGHKSYSTFINKLKKGGIALDRKVLADLAANHPESFARLAKPVA
ncbi:MAG TPA: 50S ribosomal protein L20 [Candidatus Paceibacterota bacterium]|nr:50S ribosomal protein L20 [Candidatus Paceibacterota bacterium]